VRGKERVKQSSSSLIEVVERRTFLKVLGSAGPAVALSACSPITPEQIIPFVIPPEDVIPGVATWYASVCGECPAGCGTLVRTREGRAVKIEGNPEHPINRGGLCVRGQSSLQGLYNPDRIPGPQRRRVTNAAAGQSVLDALPWDDAQQDLVDRVQALRDAGRGDRIAVITPPLTGTMAALTATWVEALGGARWVRYEPFAYEATRESNRQLFGRAEVPHYDFANADYLISFGADFLETFSSPVGYARDHAGQRRVRNGEKARFVQVEPRLSMTGASADEWHAVSPETEGLVAAAMIQTIIAEQRAQGVPPETLDAIAALVSSVSPDTVASTTGLSADGIRDLAREFSDPARGPGRSLAVGGGVGVSGANATATASTVALLNYVAGNVGRTVDFGAASTLDASTYADMQALGDSMRAGDIELAIIYNVNPVFAMPGEADFAGALAEVPFVISLSSLPDETTAHADLLLPTHTPLESWGDSNPRRGVYGLLQPTMQPVFDTRHAGDVMIAVGRALGRRHGGQLPASRRFLPVSAQYLAGHAAPARTGGGRHRRRRERRSGRGARLRRLLGRRPPPWWNHARGRTG
jgi:anaerobic selenocysteine-containing dehydrogenase